MVDRLFLCAGVFAALYLPVLLWRIHEIGWYVQLQVHALLIAMLLLLAPLRRRLAVPFKAALVLGAVIALGSSGVVTNGMVGAGYWWCLQAAGLGAILYSFRVGIALAVASAVLMTAVGVGFVSGVLIVPFDLRQHLHSNWIGFLIVVTFAPMALLFAYGGYQDAIEKLVAEIDMQRRALAAQVGHDPLTGLPQAALAEDRLQTALRETRRSGATVALLFVDLDGFKAVNDRHGHAAGDFVLRQVASCLRGQVRAHDTVARVGGDEFIVVLSCLADAAMAGRIAARIVEQIAAIASWQGRPLQLGASVGVALYPVHGLDGAALRHSADAAMYAAKQGGRNGWRLAASAPAAGC